MANVETKEIDSITITYKDGTQKTLDKGMVVSTAQENDELSVNMAMFHMNGKEFQLCIESMAMAYLELTEESEENE